MRSAVIVDVVRTASGRGKSGGALSGTHPVELLAAVLRQLQNRTGIDPGLVGQGIFAELISAQVEPRPRRSGRVLSTFA
jgi:acetyl-CoA acetyltransferase